ncbi:MAG: hypothetical protein RMI91_12760 [Gemmatales bacterium]|nr:hypothetical protein [Gemmatales bacterium]MDW7995513.1 hypothetical protein [Gemmatales bacterium]
MRRIMLSSLLGGLAALWGALPVNATGFCSAGGVCPSACPDHCAQPRIRYKTCYQTVVEEKKITCYETVTKTVMKEVKEVVCRPVYETKEVECKQIICKPVWEEKQVKVCTYEWQTVQECVPGRERCKLVWVPGGCYVDPCTGCTRYRWGHFERQLVKEPDRIICKRVCVPKEEIRTVKVCRMVQEEVIKKVPVTTCRMVREEVTKQVPITVCERVPVEKTVKVCKRVKVCVPVCEEPHLLERLYCRLKNGLHGWLCRKDCCQTAAHTPAPPAPEMIKPMPKEKPE